MNSMRLFTQCMGCVVVACASGVVGAAPLGPMAPITPPARPATTFEKVTYSLTGGIEGRNDEITLFADGRIETPDSPSRLVIQKLKPKSPRAERGDAAEKDAKDEPAGAAAKDGKEKDEPRPPVLLSHYLLQEDLDKLSDLVKQIDWSQIRPMYASAAVSTDGFAEKISTVIAGQRHETVITDPDAHLPTPFQSLVSYLKELQGTYGVFGQLDRTSPGDFSRLRWIYKTTRGSEEYSTFLEITKDLSFYAWQRRKRTVWGLWTEEKVVRSLRGVLGQQEFSKLQKLTEGIGWDKLGDGSDARTAVDVHTHSLWLDVGKRTYYFMCSETKTPAALKPFFEHLEEIEKAHRIDQQ